MKIKAQNISLAIIFIIPIISAILVLVATRFNIGISPDSTYYISAAQSIIEQGEIRSIFEGSQRLFLTHFPPGYPIILSATNFFTTNIYEATRFSNAFFMFTLLLTVGLITYKYIPLIPTLLIQILLVTNYEIFILYRMAWSEPSYLFFSLIGLYTLHLFVKTKNITWLFFSGLIISTAVAIRYLGVTLIFTSVIYLWYALSNTTILYRITN